MAPNAPAVHAVIFDLDGTLVDTNDAHVEAWLAAFRDFGYHVPRDRILPEIGKGGDKLVPRSWAKTVTSRSERRYATRMGGTS